MVDERKCAVELVPDGKRGWKLRVGAMNSSCEAVLKGIYEGLGPHGRRYLARRVEAGTPEIEEKLKELGLKS